MVGGVESTVGSSAYLKGSQLGSSSSASRNKPAERETAPVSFVKERDDVSSTRSTDETKSASSTSRDREQPQKTELQAKNDNSTLQTEQARGSLLDIAV